MNETAEPRSKAQDTVAMTAATMGHDVVAMILNELRTMPGHWPTLNAEYQQKAVERFKEKTTDMIRKAIGFMLTSDFAAVPAKLEDLSRRKAINARLTIATNAMYRHALFDAQGQHVLLVIADPDKWLTRMDEIKARGNQLDLFDPDANYDSERDQPGYRRDRDPLAPGKSWEELKRSLGHSDTGAPPPAPAAAAEPAAAPAAPQPEKSTSERRQEAYDAAFLRIYGKANKDLDETERTSPAVLQAHEQAADEALQQVPLEVVEHTESLTPEQEHTATLRELQEALAAIGVEVSLGALQSQDDANILAASLWLKWYKSEGIDVPFLDKPSWLPDPPPKPTTTTHKGKKK